MKLAPYPEYKNAGVSSVGSIPAHWPEKRAKYYFKEIDERSQTGDEEMLSVSHITGVTPRSQKNVTMFKSESNVGQKLCQPGDLVINTMWAWMSALGVSNHAGIVSPAYGVYRPRDSQNFDYYYLNHLLRIEGYRSEYICRSTGVRSSRLRLYPDKFLSMPIVCPPQDEQRTIAWFLKLQDRLFKKFIHNKRRLIQLLKEQKQNVINQAVTRGLNTNTKLKPSGVEWIGDIPEHWEVLPIKRLVCTKMADGPHETPRFADNGIPFVSAEAVCNGRINLNKRRADISFGDHEKYCQKVRPQLDDIFIVKSGSTTGKCCIVDFSEEFSIWSPLALVRVNQRIKTYFMFCSLSSTYFQQQVQDRWSFGTQPNIGMGVLENLKVAYPKSIIEQQEILDFVTDSSAAIDQTITRAQREIELIREYQTRMTSDVVTGKVDVRGIEVLEVAEEDLPALDEEAVETDDVIDDERGMEAEE